MKKRKILYWLLFAAVMLLLSGCGSREEEAEKGYKVYYVSPSGTKLQEASYEPSAQTFEELMDELLGQLALPPSGSTSALRDKTQINGYERGIDALRIDFDQGYYDLTNIEEVLLRAAVVKTICQIPGVTKVMITVEKQQFRDAKGNLVPAMDSSSFIDTQEGGINSYLFAALTLYFPDSGTNQLVKEIRNLHYSSNMVLERVVVEQLIEGPEESGRKALFNNNVRIQNLYIQNGICTISLDAEANKMAADLTLDPQTVLDAVVDSICETCDGITGVRFEIEGDSSGLFRDAVELNQVFVPDTQEADMETSETTEQQAQDAAAPAEGSTEQEVSNNETEGEAGAGQVVGVDPSLAEE